MRVKCYRFELLTLLECEGRVRKDFQMGGVTSFSHATVPDEVSFLGLVLPTPPLLHWEQKPCSTNIPFKKKKKNPFQSQLSRNHKNEGVPFLSNALWVTSPFSQLPYPLMPLSHNYFHSTTHTKTHACTHVRSHEAVSCTGNGDGVTKTGLILALNIWCAERSLVCVFHQDVPRCLSFSASLTGSQVRDCKETYDCLKK